MSAEVEVRVRVTGHGTVHMHRKEEPDVVRSGNGDRTEALKLLDAMVVTAREELGAPPVPPVGSDEAKAYGWMRTTLHGVAEALGIAAPHMPAANEVDERWGADLAIAVRALVSGSLAGQRWDFLTELGQRLGVAVDRDDRSRPMTTVELRLLAELQDVLDRKTVDAQAALLLTPERMAELLWDSGTKPWGGRPWSEIPPGDRGSGQMEHARELLRMLAGLGGDAPTARAVAYVRDAASAEAERMRLLADAIGRRAESTPSGAARQAYADAAGMVREVAQEPAVLSDPDAALRADREQADIRRAVHGIAGTLGLVVASGESTAQALASMEKAVIDWRSELARLRRRASDYDRMADAAWALIQDATQGADEPDDEEWKAAALRWHDTVFGEGTVPADTRWLVDKYLREHDMVLVSGEEARRLGLTPASREWLDVLRGGRIEFTGPDVPPTRWFVGDPKSVDAELTDRLNAKANGIATFLKAWQGKREQRAENITRAYAEGRLRAEPSKWLTNGELTAIVDGDESLVKAWREDRLRVVADPAPEGSNPVTLRVGKGAGAPVILDAEHPHGSFSLRASRPKGDIAPGGPLDLGDGVTTVAEVGRALARFDGQFPVSRHAAVTTLPQRIHELVDHAERLRGEPAQRTLALANLLGVTREQRHELFEGKDEDYRWNTVLVMVYERLGELRAVQDVLEGVVSADASLNPDGGRTPSQVVALMADRQTVWAASAANELGDPGVDVLAAWLEFALKQGEGKTGVQVGDAAGFPEWRPLLRVAAEHVLLCAAGVRAEHAGRPTSEPMTIEKLSGLIGEALREEKPDVWWIDDERPAAYAGMCRGIAARLLAQWPDDSMDRMVVALVDNLMLPSIELQEFRELLERTAPIERWSAALKAVQARCLAFYGIKALVQPWNGVMKRPEDVVEAVRMLAEEKHTAQLAEGESLDERVRQAFFGQVAESRSPEADTSALITRDDFWHGVGARLSASGSASPAFDVEEIGYALGLRDLADAGGLTQEAVEGRIAELNAVANTVDLMTGEDGSPAILVSPGPSGDPELLARWIVTAAELVARRDGRGNPTLIPDWDEAVSQAKAFWIAVADTMIGMSNRPATDGVQAQIADIHGVPREFVGAPPVSWQVLGGWIRDAFAAQVGEDRTESSGMDRLVNLDGFWHEVGARVSERLRMATGTGFADAFDEPSTALTADEVRTAYRETLERLSGEREVFPVDAPEPGPQVLAVRELDHLDTDDAAPTDVLYARQSNNPAHWYATTGPLVSKRWDELNGNPLVDCTGEVDYITVPMEDHGKGYRVYRRSTGETLSEGPFFDVRSANERVHELNTAARPMVLDCEHPRRHPAGRCADCGVPAPEIEE